MTIENFVEQLKAELETKLSPDHTISVQKVHKNNGLLLTGLMIQKASEKMIPTIYVDSFFDDYQKGLSMQKIVDQILKITAESHSQSLDMNFFTDFEKVKPRIAYKLIHAGKNQELLDTIPHIIYLDMAICFYYSFDNLGMGNGSILINNNHMDEIWHTNTEELYQLAKENTSKILPVTFQTMQATLVEMIGDSLDFKHFPKNSLFILSNRQKYLGAAAILYPGVLDQIRTTFQADFYVIPSSVHETLLIPMDGLDAKNIHSIIVEANRTVVEQDEILSDSLYEYREETKLLQICRLRA
ncbi:MAG: DUF5688 family protein [Lachnospiraceae bacterium]|jgi:hypothetical protein|nr:DUF5688 family protein [Lachnospiraceae bacterium]